jgi:hypothetical protein
MTSASLWVLSRRAAPAAGGSEHPAGIPLEGFADERAAEDARKRFERAAREQTPAGSFLKRLLPKGANDIAAAAKAAGLPPPSYVAVGSEVRPVREGNRVTYPKEYSEYCDRLQQAVAAWWAGLAADITPEANAVLWDALFPQFCFYAIGRVLFEE